MKYLITIFYILSSIVYSNACGNEYGFTIDGRKINTRTFFLSDRMLTFDTSYINKRISVIRLWVKNAPQNHKHWSDLAVNFLKVGKVDSAIHILAPLARKHPDEYNITANLGTAYELNGQLDSALKYITKGFELNPKSHLGSEWVHIKILQAKIKNKRSPGWLRRNNIISQNELISRINTSDYFPAGVVNSNLFYQIRTRAPFTPAPNQVIKNLLLSLGDFNTNHGTYENALMCYVYAMKFEDQKYNLNNIKNKIRFINKKRADQETPGEVNDIFLNMIKRSQINPEILLLGLEDFANHLDSVHLKEFETKDSIVLLKNQLDSIQNLKETSKIINETNEKDNSTILIGVLGLIIGIIGALVGGYYYRKRS